jgi:hypothetical protein
MMLDQVDIQQGAAYCCTVELAWAVCCLSAAINTAMLPAGVLKALALAFIPTKDMMKVR